MIEINLIPDVKRELLRTRSLRNAVVSFSVLIGAGTLATAVVLGLVLGGQLAAEALQDGAIKQQYKELSSIEDLDKTVTIQRQLEQLAQLHDNKQIHSRLFDVMSAVNPSAPNNVQFATIKLNTGDKTINLEGSAANGYPALEALKKTIISTTVRTRVDGKERTVPLAQDIRDGETSFGENAEGKKVLRFSFRFTYPEELFAVSREPVAVVTPVGRIDVTDSKLGVPESLFSKKPKDAKKEEQ